MRVRPPGWPIAALALAAAVAAATPANHLMPETESAGDSGARMEWVNSSGADQGLAWTTEERSGRVLVRDRAGFVFVERRLRRAVDDMGYRYVEPTQALPAGTPSGHAIVLPGGGLPAAGPVRSIPAPQFEPGRDGTHTLRHPRIGQAGLSQRCRPDPEQHIWCAIAISNGAQVRILDIYVAADARHAGRRRLEMSFTGDLNRDGVFDVMFGWDSGGGVSCTAEYLFVSLRTPGGWRWPMAGDSACD